MPKMLTPKTGAEEEAILKAAIEEIFAEMDVLDTRIAFNQAETARLRAETWAILSELKTTLRMFDDGVSDLGRETYAPARNV